jgi:uncharacterized protein GlcG (DUF336 family)
MIVECSANHRRRSSDPLFGMQESNSGEVVIFRGGDPIVSGGNIIGAVTTSTGTIEQTSKSLRLRSLPWFS